MDKISLCVSLTRVVDCRKQTTSTECTDNCCYLGACYGRKRYRLMCNVEEHWITC